MSRLRRLLRRVLRWLGVSLAVAVLISIGLTLPLRWVDPPGSMFMVVDRWLHGRTIEHQWVEFDRISPELALAVLAAEDQNFPHHRGLDLGQIRSAITDHRHGGRLRGASTISQQVARNLYLWPDRGWMRKGLELWFTIPLELFLPKRRILEIHLNVAEFSTGVYGVEAGAQHHFSKSASVIDRQEAAWMAAVLPAPKRLDPAHPERWLIERQRWIVRQMENLGADWVP